MFIFNQKCGCMDLQTKNTTHFDICSAFHAVKLIVHTDEKTSPELQFEVNDHNNFDEGYLFTLPVSLLSDMKEVHATLLANRLTIPMWARGEAHDYIETEYYSIVKKRLFEYRHSALGWTFPKKAGLPAPYTYALLQTSNTPLQAENNPVFLWQKNIVNGHVSLYDNPNLNFTSGKESDYISFLKTVIFPEQSLTLALAIGYSAVLSARLDEETGCGTLVVNLCGASSTGKSTVQMLMVSPFASPNSNGHGLVRTFQATQNALLAGLGEMHGLPIALDDSSTNPNMNFTNLLYSLAEGQGRQRCESDGSLKSQKNWSGTIIISSEIPIQEQACENQGLKARILNFSNIQWTPDAQTAELIKRTVRCCYGHTGYDFALYVSNIPFDDLVQRYYIAKKCVHSLMILRDNLSDRLEVKYAILYLTIQLLNDYFNDSNIFLNADALMKLALIPEQNSIQERNIAQKALDIVVEYVFRKRNHFNEFREANFAKKIFPFERLAQGDDCGTIRIRASGQAEVFIPQKALEEELQKNSIQEVITVLKRWRDIGVISCESGRLQSRMPKLKGLDTTTLQRRYIHFIFPNGIKKSDDIQVTEEITELTPILEENFSAASLSDDYTPDDFPDDDYYCGYPCNIRQETYKPETIMDSEE